METKKKRLKNLSRGQKAALAVQLVIQFALLIAALWDIRRRPAVQIRGSKKLWVGLAFVNYIGPIAYFLIGRRKPGPAESIAEELLAA